MLPRPSGTAALVLPVLLTALLAVSGCGGSGKSGTAEPSGTATTSGSGPTTTPSSTPTPTSSPTDAVGTPTPTPADCAAGAGRALPDGTWTGPITMTVRGVGGRTEFTSSPGRGTLDLVVADGKVTGGSWQVRWTSRGHAETANASAAIHVTGTIKGAWSGRDSAPETTGTWTLTGAATITEPQQATAPIDETGPLTATMKVRASDCRHAGGTFAPSFTSKDTLATFTDKATWTATRQD
jgi:hypothetical protein